MKKRTKIAEQAPPLRFRAYELIDRAVEEGISYGWNRAHKHISDPEPEFVKEQIGIAVMGALCEIMDFDPPSADEGEV
jgi:hypothetical protein